MNSFSCFMLTYIAHIKLKKFSEFPSLLLLLMLFSTTFYSRHRRSHSHMIVSTFPVIVSKSELQFVLFICFIYTQIVDFSCVFSFTFNITINKIAWIRSGNL